MFQSSDLLSQTAAIEVLAVGSSELGGALDRIFRRSNWLLRHVRTCREAIAFVNHKETGILICEAQLPDANWAAVLSELKSVAMPPTLIVTSPYADDALWATVLNLGGYDVIAQPFDAQEVFRVLSSAWARWHNLWKPRLL
jgi:DNA-binding response OmpR family regulator